MYKVKSLKINKSLARKTGCKTRIKKNSIKRQIAYYSSGSRPNQTVHS